MRGLFLPHVLRFVYSSTLVSRQPWDHFSKRQGKRNCRGFIRYFIDENQGDGQNSVIQLHLTEEDVGKHNFATPQLENKTDLMNIWKCLCPESCWPGILRASYPGIWGKRRSFLYILCFYFLGELPWPFIHSHCLYHQRASSLSNIFFDHVWKGYLREFPSYRLHCFYKPLSVIETWESKSCPIAWTGKLFCL